MFTRTFPRERYIEELRAELRGTLDLQEWREIRAELDALLSMPDRPAEDERAAT